jgi:hypothetical protein
MERTLLPQRFVTCIFLMALCAWAQPGSAQTTIEVAQNEAWIDFPESVDFHLMATAESPIVSAEIEHGVDALACGDVATVTTPHFEPDAELDLTWRWDILEGPLIPPGSQIWWQWQLTTEDGNTVTTPRQTATFLDDWFVWQSLTAENVTVHWYRGPQSLGQQMLDAALVAIDELDAETGLRLSEPVNLYLYDETFDLQVSLPGAPAWAGGAAFPEHNVVLVTTNTAALEYGVSTTRHEIGHLVIGRLTFNCTNPIPTWLNEGLAMVAEGTEDLSAIEMLDEAIENDAVLTISQLEGSFSVHTNRALLSYAQSYNLVRYLIDTYGQAQMLSLLETFRAGATPDDALMMVYGFNTNGLEDEWRAAIGAGPRPQDTALNQEEPTPVPTLSLLGPAVTDTAVPSATAPATEIVLQAPTETAVPATNTPPPLTPTPTPMVIESPPPQTTNRLLFSLIGISLSAGLMIAFLFLRQRNQ